MMNQRLSVGIKTITQAGDYLRSQFLKKHKVSLKKDKTVLLGEDLRSEEILLSAISKAFPQDSFLTEETDTTITTDTIWVFDPLCGSYSYLRGVETWSISAAFIAENKFQLGIVYQPYSQNLYFSELGKGTYMNKQKIHTSAITTVKDAFISIEHGVFNNRKFSLEKLVADMKRLRVGHGSGGELSYVAAGFLDAVIKTDQALMHFAGGRAIVEGAGGVFMDFSGKVAPIYLDRERTTHYIACANKTLAEEIRTYLLDS